MAKRIVPFFILAQLYFLGYSTGEKGGTLFKSLDWTLRGTYSRAFELI